ncbi:ABC transporter permease [Paenibacillus aurantius]|uniref:ABC transporter permease n=1 Tax=Paenibacillus aurantius TaxID=2918900 RepID=A0AA96LBS4_9BACL|nr:ABC transporter permease [Paenibacillus aurantius]WNQ09181.1 ABC transporter permease [Paenibacillus aurantius]
MSKTDLLARQPELIRHIHKEYLSGKRARGRKVLAVQFLILAGFLGLWEAAGRLKWIDVLLFSYPSKVTGLLISKLQDGSLLPHIGITVTETVIGFLLGTLCGTALAVVIWWSPFLEKVLDPYIVVLNSMPKVALGPLFIVGLGPGLFSIIGITLSVTVIVTTLVIFSSFREVDPNYIKVVRLFGGNRAAVFRKVVLPAAFPAIVSTLKVNVGLAWIGVIVGEFLVSKEGLGYLIIYGFQVFNFTLVIGSLFIIALVAAVMYQAVVYLEGKLIGGRR